MAKTAKVEGVLKYNVDTRNEHLRRNAGKYSQYMMELTPAIGEAYDIKSRAVHSLTNSESLLKYTHGDSSYSDVIKNLNFRNVDEKETFSSNDELDERQMRWRGAYTDYLKYISEVYGEAPAVSTLKGFTSFFIGTDGFGTDLPKNLATVLSNTITPMLNRSVTVGYIHYNKPYDAISGAIVTNPNTTDTDTNLGLLGGRIYALNMQRGAYYGDAIGTASKYLTPMLHYTYGLNSDTLPKLGEGLTVDDATGRMPDIGAANDAYIQEYTEGSSATNGGRRYLESELLYSTFYSPRAGSGYVQFSGIDALRGSISNISEFTENGITAQNKSEHHVSNKFWNEGDTEDKAPDAGTLNTSGVAGVSDTKVDEISFESKKSLTSKTRELFKNHTIKTLVGRFHTSSDTPGNTEVSVTDTAKTKFGNSHGRNLLKKEAKGTTNGYSDPYCRVWTYHKQYDRVNRLIRPFNESIGTIQANNKLSRSHYPNEGEKLTSGDKYLAANTVLNRNTGIVDIAPSDSDKGEVDIKKCMFSIENLAWKDVLPRAVGNLSEEQRGPNGGRIMWFPPYDLDFQESVNVNWQSNEFIGRGEKIYTYANTDRTGTLSFSLLIDHPSIIDTYKDTQTDDDILRFFAGCAPLESAEKSFKHSVENETTDNSSNNTDGKKKQEGGKESSNDVNGFVFYVFFPNNYSGNSGIETKYASNTKWKNRPIDSDWVDYLMIGNHNIQVPMPSADADKKLFVGYEMGKSGISTVSATISVEEAANGTGGLANYIAVCAAGKNGGCMYNGVELSETKAPLSDAQLKKLSNGERRKYQYRVDYDLRQPGLTIQDTDPKIDNYKDSNTFNLNCSLKSVRENGKTISSDVGVDFQDANCTFADIVYFSYLLGNMTGGKYDIMKDFLVSGETDNDTYAAGNSEINYIYPNATTKQFKKVKKITINGYASSHDQSDAKVLANRRAKSVRDFIKTKFGDIYELPDDSGWEVNGDKYVTVSAADKHNVNGISAKMGRMVKVVMEFDDNVLDEAVVTADKPTKSTITTKTTTTYKREYNVRRYETEAEYFEKLDKDDSFNNEYAKTLKSKFKYFDPAFHSISPEGFNARLTFLQQCTRQGHTIEATQDGNMIKAAGNLAFGRMPVCVLRIGDFIYNRILIQSMSINYGNGGMQWDLNPEGAGVQPMYAKISLGIVILGGASLEGPINRLQNAVSFNYYANAPVYDDRADRCKKSADGKDDYYHMYTPDNNDTKKGIWGKEEIESIEITSGITYGDDTQIAAETKDTQNDNSKTLRRAKREAKSLKK